MRAETSFHNAEVTTTLANYEILARIDLDMTWTKLFDSQSSISSVLE